MWQAMTGGGVERHEFELPGDFTRNQ
jgi:hypothetical protein